jgi:class 3 adenylate cyclase
MHREFRTLLDDAKGFSEPVIAVFIDVRGFSAFSQEMESPDTAMYIKRVYIRLIDEYFPGASFYKPTGDGLMVILPFDEKSLPTVSAAAVQGALACVEGFPKICEGDLMINFDVPKKVGIGIARGTACKLTANDKVLDYSGRLLNLSARLMNIARPMGIVIDGDFKMELIPEAVRPRFKATNVFLRGIAENAPRVVYTADTVSAIPKENLSRPEDPKWHTLTYEKTLAELNKMGRFRLNLVPVPTDSSTFVIQAIHQAYRKGKPLVGQDTIRRLDPKMYAHQIEGDSQQIIFVLPSIVNAIRADKVPFKVKVKLTAKYRVR